MKKFLYLILIAISSLLHAENWTGTGWALKGGYIVTNFHCVDGAKSIVVRGSNNFNADVAAVDKVNDLAIIKINDSAFRGFGEIPYSITRKQCELGESVWTLGYPMMEIMGEDVKFTDGRISSKTGFQGELQTYQITVPIQPGNSGGALFNQYGNVVGVTSSGLNKAIADNVNYAIKTIYLLNLIDSKLSTDILPTGNTSGLSLTDKIKKIRSYVFPLYFSSSSKGSNISNNSGTENGHDITNNSGIENGHEYVDLGLSVKWATCNVGASTPEGYGYYFAWGETQPKSTYNWSTYKWCYGSYDTQTKYCTSSSFGTVDNKTVLEPADDAATVNWGGSWRMPTKAEQDELRNNCTWTWTTQNGVNGYKVTSKSNGNSIFLPAAGYRDDSSLSNAGSTGYFWSSSLLTDYPYRAYGLSFYSVYVSRISNYRYYGQSVRPVCQ
jgi:hypothetical protein